jgi:hypothetical protein
MKGVNGIPSYHVSQTKTVYVFQLHLPSGHSLLNRGPYLYTQHAGSGDTKLPFMITERTILHDLENSSNFRDFVVDMFTEKIVTWN